MFSESTRMRPACARRPDAAMASDLTKSMAYLRSRRSGLVGGDLQQAEALAVELRRGLVVHLVLRDLEHLVLQVHRIAGRPHLVLIGIAGEIARIAERRQMARIGPHQSERRRPAGRSEVEPRLDQV